MGLDRDRALRYRESRSDRFGTGPLRILLVSEAPGLGLKENPLCTLSFSDG